MLESYSSHRLCARSGDNRRIVADNSPSAGRHQNSHLATREGIRLWTPFLTCLSYPFVGTWRV